MFFDKISIYVYCTWPVLRGLENISAWVRLQCTVCEVHFQIKTKCTSPKGISVQKWRSRTGPEKILKQFPLHEEFVSCNICFIKAFNWIVILSSLFIIQNNKSKYYIDSTLSVADPGFSSGGGGTPTPQSGCANLLFCRKLHENERIWTGGVPGAPLDPTLFISRT